VRGLPLTSAPSAGAGHGLDADEATGAPRRGRGVLAPVGRGVGAALPPQASDDVTSTTERLDSVPSTVTDHLPNAIAPRTSLGG
jgi:hypothetical protein